MSDLLALPHTAKNICLAQGTKISEKFPRVQNSIHFLIRWWSVLILSFCPYKMQQKAFKSDELLITCGGEFWRKKEVPASLSTPVYFCNCFGTRHSSWSPFFYLFIFWTNKDACVIITPLIYGSFACCKMHL